MADIDGRIGCSELTEAPRNPADNECADYDNAAIAHRIGPKLEERDRRCRSALTLRLKPSLLDVFSMDRGCRFIIVMLLCASWGIGCRTPSGASRVDAPSETPLATIAESSDSQLTRLDERDHSDDDTAEVGRASYVWADDEVTEDSDIPPAPAPLPTTNPDSPAEAGSDPELDELSRMLNAHIPRSQDASGIQLDQVISSVYRSYPSLQAALFQFQQADGVVLSANGQFDTSFKASTENGPVGFYETYRHTIGISQPVYAGGEVFAGYRLGRGEYQPWYLERETNEGGEFRAGVAVPLLQDLDIDSRRARLWQAEIARQQVNPDVQAQLIGFVQAGSDAYWGWVAAGHKLRIYDRVYRLAEQRQQGLERRAEVGDIDPPVVDDNRRLSLSREALVFEARRKFQEAAIKLSLYLRDPSGMPIVLGLEDVPEFPDVEALAATELPSDVQFALRNRPELRAMGLMREQLEVEYQQAENTYLPTLDLVMSGSQDVGGPTSSKEDKSPFELEIGLFGDVPLQRREAEGKLRMIEAKLAELNQKMRLAGDTITAEVQAAYAAVIAEYEQIALNREAVRIAENLADIERRKLELGESDLLSVILREQYAAETAIYEIDALLRYFKARADYRAALGTDRVR